VYDWLFRRIAAPIRVAVLETPAGFQPNSAGVAGEVAQFLRQRLQNYRPQVTVVPADMAGGVVKAMYRYCQVHTSHMDLQGRKYWQVSLRELLDLARRDVRRESQIAHPGPGFFLLSRSGRVPRREYGSECHRRNQPQCRI
jgi:hypothetical protein